DGVRIQEPKKSERLRPRGSNAGIAAGCEPQVGAGFNQRETGFRRWRRQHLARAIDHATGDRADVRLVGPTINAVVMTPVPVSMRGPAPGDDPLDGPITR